MGTVSVQHWGWGRNASLKAGLSSVSLIGATELPQSLRLSCPQDK